MLRGREPRASGGAAAHRHVARAGPDAACSSLPPEEQYLVASGRTYFRELGFDQLRRLQFDLETTGLDPAPIASS